MAAQIAMVVLSYYPADPRPRREAEALVDEGTLVDVICLRGGSESKHEIVNGVHVYRLPLEHKRGRKLRYIWEYACFFMISTFTLSVLYMRKRYRIIHVHNMPDFLVFCSFIPRLFGAKIILDLHDPSPEVFMAKYSIGMGHPFIRFLKFIEKISIKFSNIVLTPNISFRDLFVSRGCPSDKIYIVMNSPDEKIFKNLDTDKYPKKSSLKEPRIMFHGTIVERHGLDLALISIKNLRNKISNLSFHIYGSGDFVNTFIELVEKLELSDIVHYYGNVSLEEIAKAIKTMDLGIIPNKKTPFTEINMPTRIFEYLSLRKPVIVPKTRGILDYFDEDSIFYFEPGDSESLSDVIFKVYSHKAKRLSVLERGVDVYKKYRWEFQRDNYLKLVKSL